MSAWTANASHCSSDDEFEGLTAGLNTAGRIAASIAHEINNPLETVTNCLYLMNHAEMDETARRYLKLAERELNRIVHITTFTLGFHRPNARPVKTDIHELIENVFSLFEGHLKARSIAVIRRFDPIPDIVVFDAEVRQVVACIIANAIDAMPPKHSGRLFVRTAFARDWTTGSEGISITIADNGSGMDHRTSRTVFEPISSTKNNSGTSVGLWVSVGVLQKHGGSIRLRTRTSKGSGSVFRIFLPLDAGKSQPKTPVVFPLSA
jgi:signal transduction histidine kinase